MFESQFWRRYRQTFSTGFSSGAREGRKIGVMLSGTSSLPVVCHPARSSSSTAWGALGDVARDFVEVELHHVGVGVGLREGRSDRSVIIARGMTSPAAAPTP